MDRAWLTAENPFIGPQPALSTAARLSDVSSREPEDLGVVGHGKV